MAEERFLEPRTPTVAWYIGVKTPSIMLTCLKHGWLPARADSALVTAQIRSLERIVSLRYAQVGPCGNQEVSPLDPFEISIRALAHVEPGTPHAILWQTFHSLVRLGLVRYILTGEREHLFHCLPLVCWVPVILVDISYGKRLARMNLRGVRTGYATPLFSLPRRFFREDGLGFWALDNEWNAEQMEVLVITAVARGFGRRYLGWS